MHIFRSNLASFSRGHASGPPRMVVPSALHLKLICDVTGLGRNFAPLGNFLRTPLVIAKILYLWHPLAVTFCVQQQAYKLSSLLSKSTALP